MLLALLLSALPAQTPYEIVDLGPLGGDASFATGLNDAGAVTGHVETVYPLGSRFAGFLWEDGVRTDLGTLGGSMSFGWAVNASRQVVGYSDPAPVKLHGFLWDAGVMSDLGVLFGSFSRAQAINDRGWIAGVSSSPVTQGMILENHSVVWIQGQILDLPTFGGRDSEALDINDAGVVVGYSEDLTQRPMPFRYTRAGGLEMLPLLDPGGYGRAQAVEDRGTIAGYASDASGNPRAVLWRAGQVLDLGTLGGSKSYAYDINHEGLVVGSSGLGPGGQGTHAFLWEQGVMHDLNTLALPGHPFQRLGSARAINDAGQIAGTGTTTGGAVHAWLATPQRFHLLGPEKGIAGRTDRVQVRHATPGVTTILVWGTQLGPGPPVFGCPGLNWGVADPSLLGFAFTNASGNALAFEFVPLALAGRYVVIQAVTSGCELSNRLAFRYRP